MEKRLNWFQENPKKAIIFTILGSLILLVVTMEILIRLYVNYNPNFYVYETDKTNTIRDYPYGQIIINSYGFADEEFSVNKVKPRVGYIGDSIGYGLGAGHEYRITELLEKDFPRYEHLNFSCIGCPGINENTFRSILDLVSQFQIDKLIYLMCLNDILPSKNKTAQNDIDTYIKPRVLKAGTAISFLGRIDSLLSFLRGRSYLFTHIRFMIKNYYMRRGYDETGFMAAELYPVKNMNVFSQTAGRIVKMAETLRSNNVDFIVVILPYEMQISSEAEMKYAENNIKWEDGFIDRGPQKTLIKYFDRFNVKYIDAIYAFWDVNNVQKSRDEYKLGHYFVYDKGDRMDWVHPNREGHKKIADYMEGRLVETGFLEK